MMKIKKIVAGVLATATLASGALCVGASAATRSYPARITLNGTSATLYNESGTTRYCTCDFYVYSRTTGNKLGEDHKGDVRASGGSLTATKTGYASVTNYYHEGYGAIYNGTYSWSGIYISVSDDDL